MFFKSITYTYDFGVSSKFIPSCQDVYINLLGKNTYTMLTGIQGSELLYLYLKRPFTERYSEMQAIKHTVTWVMLIVYWNKKIKLL